MCMVCKKDSVMLELDLSNNIKINEYYDSSDAIEYCIYCGALFLKTDRLSKHEEEEGGD